MLDKITFCEAIESLRQQILFDNQSAENIKEMFGVAQKCSYKNDFAIKALIKLLQFHFPKDEDGHCQIEYYCFIVEFGKEQDKELVTPEELYDLLTKK
ncbi:MAG: hypothetical protein V4666_08130 [Bacteroidota bacterium]